MRLKSFIISYVYIVVTLQDLIFSYKVTSLYFPCVTVEDIISAELGKRVKNHTYCTVDGFFFNQMFRRVFKKFLEIHSEQQKLSAF